MLTIDIPGAGIKQLRHLVLDFNGTIACDGRLIPGIDERLVQLSSALDISVITADTHGTAAEQTAHLPLEMIVIPAQNQDQHKLKYIETLGLEAVAAIGNGSNDRLMLRSADLGIALMQQEGVAAAILQTADILMTDINAALDLLLKPKRLIATLRN